MTRSPLVLLILDGWGKRDDPEFNAVAAGAPYFAEVFDSHPHTFLTACGREVGLPDGVMGNSEVGHMNLGAGRVVYQDVSRIDRAIEDGVFQANATIVDLMAGVRERGTKLHFVGLVSDGMVHASDEHLRALIQLAADLGLGRDQVIIHAITDGRDTPPRSGEQFVQELESACERIGVGRVASVIGRYFAMDRDKRWERVRQAYDLFVHGKGGRAESGADAVRASYESGVNDEFIEPVAIGDPAEGRISSGDGVMLFNYRADRMRQITDAFVQETFDGFERDGGAPSIDVAAMTSYRDDLEVPVAFPPVDLTGIFGELVSEAGLRQERIAETEKYAHVTYYFSGGREEEYDGESRTLIPSPKVATYDLEPAMSAEGVTTALLESLQRGETDVYVVNFANPDMVGHTGVYDAAVEAVATVDACLRRIVSAVEARGGTLVITADHGNSEQMWDPTTDQPHTAHTLNPVPFVLVGAPVRDARLRASGILADVAPTLLELLGLEKHEQMDGASLLRS
ncbi:MAG: 2,3-bisphosphoglycerate-independent phosphoglycerate mutase [Planctomycetota bacterium]